jgi:hypothetical protein
MYLGVEETTDRRSPETKIKVFRTEATARKWLSVELGFAWPAAANPALPVTQRNFHRRIRTVYEMPARWQRPNQVAIQKARGSRPWEDRRTDLEIVVASICRAALRTL